jgi:hypothetical protein
MKVMSANIRGPIDSMVTLVSLLGTRLPLQLEAENAKLIAEQLLVIDELKELSSNEFPGRSSRSDGGFDGSGSVGSSSVPAHGWNYRVPGHRLRQPAKDQVVAPQLIGKRQRFPGSVIDVLRPGWISGSAAFGVCGESLSSCPS